MPRVLEAKSGARGMVSLSGGSLTPMAAMCEGCGQEIDPVRTDTGAAVEMVPTVAVRPTVEYTEGLGVLFHEHCYPEGSSRYRRKGGNR